MIVITYHFYYFQYAWYRLDVVHPWTNGTRAAGRCRRVRLVCGRQVRHDAVLWINKHRLTDREDADADLEVDCGQ